MDGHALHVWGALGLALLAMVLEAGILLLRRHRQLSRIKQDSLPQP